MMGISKGSINDFVTRVYNPILKDYNQVIKWPNEEESSTISGRIQKFMVSLTALV